MLQISPRRILFLCGCWLASNAVADVKLAGLFVDHAILQRDKPVPVWGWSAPGDTVAVEFAGQTKSATADPTGRWQVTLDPMPSSSEARELVALSKTQNQQTKIADVLVGEVWFASGQSNMHWTFAPGHSVLNNEEELESARDPLVRQFTVTRRQSPEPLTSLGGEWHPCTRPNLLKNGQYGDSALAYFFARELRRSLDVPVGIINASMGGVSIESWTSEPAQLAEPELQAMVESRKPIQAAYEKEIADYNEKLAEWKQAVAAAKASQAPPPAEPKKPRDPLNYHRPAVYFNGMIAPVIPYAIRGALWYQGEANSRSIESGLLYRKQLPVLIEDWRARWGKELPVAWVQLPNYTAGPGWLLVREAMLLSLAVPRTGMAVAIDIGDPTDIHPKNKQEVARRLSLWALGEVYSRDVPATTGPLPAGHEVRGNAMVVTFKHANGGLQAKNGELRGFQIAGDDRQWKPASAKIEGDKVMISSSEVPTPAAVRYAWESNPDCNLFNGAGLPASPFRTDDWPLDSTKAKAR